LIGLKDLISVKRDLISVKRDLISVKRDLSFSFDLLSLELLLLRVVVNPAAVLRAYVIALRCSVKRGLISVKRDLRHCPVVMFVV